MMKQHAVLRLTGRQYAELARHLLPGDGLEAGAILLCGRRDGNLRLCLVGRDVYLIPYELCARRPDQLRWPSEWLVPLLETAVRHNLSVVKVHSHPGGYPEFSKLDDRTDHDFFASLPAWFDRDFAHGSAILLPDGRVRGRIFEDAHGFHSIGCVAIAGDDLKFHYTGGLTPDSAEFSMRHAQLFGAGTIARLKRLSIAVVGCSGTGSLVIMQLARLGVGKLVLVDPDHIEEKNLGRILPATMDDVYRKRLKVDVMRRWLEESGLGTQTETFACNLANPDAVLAVAACDVAFGCMDGVEGRHLLNRLAAFYVLPYFDVGVKLEADGIGGIDQISGAVHYLQPGGSSLLSRGVYKLEQVKAEGLKRTNPQAYREQVASKYISGVQEDRPAVVSVNMHYASMAVNEFLARLHPYRDDPNRDFAMVRTSLTQTQSYCGPGGVPCKLLAPHVGRGDVHPLLDRPDLSDPGGIR